MRKNSLLNGSAIMVAAALAACSGDAPTTSAETEVAAPPVETVEAEPTESKYLNEPLVSEIFTADPSVHVWDDGRIYVYPSHDYDAGIPEDDLGSQYAMRDYIVLSMDEVGGEVTIHDVALDVDDVAWAAQQMWAPDAAHKDDKYYLYFPAKDADGVFHIGAAVSDSPTGPFTAEPEPIEGSYSMDPTVYEDTDGEYYMYFGGIWGGQLQRWATGEYNTDPNLNTDLVNDDPLTSDDVALMPKIAKMGEDMVSFAEAPKDVMILDEHGDPIKAKDHDRRFFEAAWMNKIGDTYYLSYSTGDTHLIVYATGDNPYGPFTYQGVINQPVEGWTNHHSIFEHNGKYYLAYHDVQLSGKSHLRNVKIAELTLNEDGTFDPVDPMPGE